MRIARVAIDVAIVAFSSFGLLATITILLLVFLHRRHHPINISMLLFCNTYPALIIGAITNIDMFIPNLYGDLYQTGVFDHPWCYLRPYVLLIGFSAIYNSYLLQACFRLFRIVFYKIRPLQRIRFITCLILLQWILSCLLTMPHLMLHDFEYIAGYYHCQIAYDNIRGLLYVGTCVHYLPMTGIVCLYVCIIHYTKKVATTRNTLHQQRQRSNQRDILVIRRIVILVGVLALFTLPFLILFLIYHISGYLHPLSYHLQWLTFGIELAVMPILTALLTPQTKRLIATTWRRHRLVQPIIVDVQQRLTNE